jgi:hypothetical protein
LGLAQLVGHAAAATAAPVALVMVPAVPAVPAAQSAQSVPVQRFPAAHVWVHGHMLEVLEVLVPV